MAFRLKISDDDPRVAYLYLDGRSGPVPGLVSSMVSLTTVLGDLGGCEINIDLNSDGVPVGLEILLPGKEDD